VSDAARLRRYYRLHARIYDRTRWAFLFGRHGLPAALPHDLRPGHVLEVGCGTGTVLAGLARAFPGARLEGLDLSTEMLDVAQRRLAPLGNRVRLRQHRFGDPDPAQEPPDLVVFSYALSMFGSAAPAAIQHAASLLPVQGCLAVVDFHDTPMPWFARWMGLNHVRMEGHLLPELRRSFHPVTERMHRAYLGLWRWFTWVGRPEPQAVRNRCTWDSSSRAADSSSVLAARNA
jgi:S-adenosylmethionine-diacylgycerolhomoserine-N-methlytransferase